MTASGPQTDKTFRGPGSAGIYASLPAKAMPAFINHRLLVQALLALAFGCLAGVGWLAYRNMQAATDSERWETHTRVVMHELGELLSSLKDAQTGQRGFLITGNPDYLAPHHESLNTFPVRLAELRRLTADNPAVQQRLAELAPLAEVEFADIKASIALREAKGLQAASESVMLESGKSTMDQIRLLVAQSLEQEAKLLSERVLARQADSRKSVQSLLLTSALGGFALLLLLVCLRREQASRRRTETARDANEERYGRLFNSMDEGFCIIELIFDQDRQPVDYLCLEANPAFERHTGICGAKGRRISEIAPGQSADGIEMYAKVLRTGEAVHFVNPSKALDRCLEGYACRIGGPESATIAVLVRDITERQRAEKALCESQRFLRASLDALSGHIAVLDESGTILEINEAWQRFADENQLPGMTASGTGIGANYLDHCRQTLQHGGEAPAYVLAIQDIIAGRRTRFEMEYPCHSPTEQRWFVMRITRFQSAGPVRIVIVHDDCSERKLAENALRESEERYRKLFNSMDEGFCIIDIVFNDQAQAVDCRFLEVNPAFSVHTGMHDIAGKRLREIAPEHQGGWLKTCGEVVLTGQPIRFTHDEKGLKFDSYAAPLGGAESRKVAIVFNNITERARAAEDLLQSEQRVRALFDWGPVAMHSCDSSGTILEFNRGAVDLWGRKPRPGETDEQFRGSFKFHHPDGKLRSYAQTGMARVLRGEITAAHNIEVVVERPDGLRKAVVGNIVPLKNNQGEIIGAINCFYDITERSRLERQTQDQAQALAELHRRKDEFLAMLSHELRNPLAPLISAAELLRRQENQDPACRQACQVIERQAGQMKHLIDDLLEVARITSGNVRLRKAPVRVADIVERALETAQPLIARRRHQLTVSLPPHPVWLDADATRLEQVLVNLLNNAAKYTDEGGHLWLSVVQEGDAGPAAGGAVAVIKVRDTGMGIAAELLPHIFDLFTQAERAIDRSQGGMGIGLSLVRQLVELHTGSVEAHSILGQGSEFVVRLPVGQAAAPPLSLPPPVATPARPDGRRCRVLTVDDSVDAVEFLAKLLRLSGHEVEVAYDGPGAVQAALAMRPDVVVLDIGLPGLTGYEVARQLRQEPALKNTVLVALTGYGRESDRQRSRNAGFSHHLVKPARVREVEEILATVGEQLALQARPALAMAPEV